MKGNKIYATDALAALRMKRGLTQGKFVGILKIYDPKITLSTYAKIETGERPTTVARVINIASALEANPWEIFKGEWRGIDKARE